MLAQTLVIMTMIAVLATSAVAGIAGYARAETANAAHVLVQPAIDAALAQYETTVIVPAISAAYAAGDGTAPPATAAPLAGGYAWSAQQYALAASESPSLAAVATVTPTTTAAPACIALAAAPAGGPDLERDGQCSPFVQESRLSIAVDVEVGPAPGGTAVAPLAHARATFTLRLVAQAPYVMVTGASVDAAPGDPHEGDLGGYAGALGTFGPPAAPGDTTIHVIEACTPALGDCSASDPAPQDDPTTLPWTNGNANPSS